VATKERATLKILGIKGSPRKRANSTVLLEQLLSGASDAGAATHIIVPWELDMAPCMACDGCTRKGRCTKKDDFQQVYDQILDCDALVVSTPIYFGAMSAQVKVLIDRCESFWSMTYILKTPMPPGPAGSQRKGVLIATAGQDREIMFQGPKITFDFLMRSLQGKTHAELLYGGLDEQGAIRQDEAAMARAYRIGRQLALQLPPEGEER
jgi:multimeric flavodoxin WrbA